LIQEQDRLMARVSLTLGYPSKTHSNGYLQEIQCFIWVKSSCEAVPVSKEKGSRPSRLLEGWIREDRPIDSEQLPGDIQRFCCINARKGSW